MVRGVKKENLPQKVCVVCERPFTWRKKWEAVWDEVTCCSKSCNRKRRAGQQQANRMQRESSNPSTSSKMSSEIQRAAAKAEVIIDDHESDNHSFHSAAEKSNGSLASSFDDTDNGDDSDRLIGSTEALDDDHTDYDTTTMEDPRAARKAAKKRLKAERRAKRQGKADPSHGQKECTVCGASVDTLIRCTIDVSAEWNMVCGKCWHDVSGGVTDGDAAHPYYRYGGLWKNRAKR